jgi:hypothetical protein
VKRLRVVLITLLVFSAVLGSAGTARAASQTVTFEGCTNTSTTNTGIGVAQLSVEVTDVGVGANQAKFIFRNSGPLASSITDVYFDDGTLLGIASITNGAGVNFSQGASPPNLPGGNNCTPANPFVTTAGFTADSNPPTQPNGVNPGESLVIVFNLISGQTFADTQAALVDGRLRIGIHVQGFAGGGSESFVNDSEDTAVSLAAFQATPGRGQVQLSWRTGTETSNAGFNLYRAASLSGPRVKVNSLLVAAQGNEVSGASYGLLDVPGYGSFYYWLEDVDTSGTSTLHGPVTASVRFPFLRPSYRPVAPSATH